MVIDRLTRLLGIPSRKNRDHILALIKPGDICAEIGVWKGEFSRQLLTRKPGELHLIDPWLYMPQYRDRWYGTMSAAGSDNSQARMDAIHDEVLQHFRGDNRVRIHRVLSEEAAARFAPASLDFVYIDGNHSYEFVKRDLELFLPLMKPTGYLTGDDYVFKGCPHGGPRRAVDELVASGRATLVSIKRNQFVLMRA